jgi:four helix bundle protein
VTPEELRERTTSFGVDVLGFCRELRQNPEARFIADQLSRSATGIASNYRCASRARSRREFISRIAVAVEEADESLGWLEIVVRARLASELRTADLLREAREILAILVASRSTAERNDPERGKRLGRGR